MLTIVTEITVVHPHRHPRRRLHPQREQPRLRRHERRAAARRRHHRHHLVPAQPILADARCHVLDSVCVLDRGAAKFLDDSSHLRVIPDEPLPTECVIVKMLQ